MNIYTIILVFMIIVLSSVQIIYSTLSLFKEMKYISETERHIYRLFNLSLIVYFLWFISKITGVVS